MTPRRPASPVEPHRSGSELLLASVAARGLPGGVATFPSTPLGTSDWKRLVEGSKEQRILGRLVGALRDGSLPGTAEQHAEARAAFRTSSVWVLTLEQQLLDVVAGLEEKDIPVRVLKGPAIARTLYVGDEALRSFVDIDLLVPGDRFEEAGGVVAARGGRRRHLEPRRGFDSRFSKAVTYAMPSGFGVDLHRTLAAGPYGFTVDWRDLFAATTPFRLAGRTLQGLDHHDAFLHACLHAMLGDRPPRLVPLRDVAQFLVGADLDLDLVLRRAASWKVEAVLALAVLTAQRQLVRGRGLPLGSWARSYRPRRWESYVLDTYVSERRDYPRQLLVALPFVPGIRSKLAYLSALALPESSYVESREGTYGRRWRHAFDLLRNRT